MGMGFLWGVQCMDVRGMLLHLFLLLRLLAGGTACGALAQYVGQQKAAAVMDGAVGHEPMVSEFVVL